MSSTKCVTQEKEQVADAVLLVNSHLAESQPILLTSRKVLQVGRYSSGHSSGHAVAFTAMCACCPTPVGTQELSSVMTLATWN